MQSNNGYILSFVHSVGNMKPDMGNVLVSFVAVFFCTNWHVYSLRIYGGIRLLALRNC